MAVKSETEGGAGFFFYCCVFQFTYRFPLHPLGGQRAGGDGRATAKGLKPSINDLPLVVHLNLMESVSDFMIIPNQTSKS